MSLATADDRLRRLLALIPWVAAEEGPTIEEVAKRFDYDEHELVKDLELLFVCGLYPFTPDTLIEADIDEGRVWIRYADYFARPLRLTPAEGLALLAAGATLLAVPGHDPDGPLARGLSKLAATLGVDLEEMVDVELAPVAAEVLQTIQTAETEHVVVTIDYYSYGRDDWNERAIHPYRTFNSAGQWYVSAYDERSDDLRLFRLDRIRKAETTPKTFEPPAESVSTDVYHPRESDELTVIELPANAQWVREQYPNEGYEELDGGRFRLKLRISERAWLERLLLRLGPESTVVEGGNSVAAEAARRILAKYRD